MALCTLHLRVRYAESDQMGVAHHAAYIPWLEAGRIEWLRQHGRSYRDLEASGILMPVVDLQIRYGKALRFDDEIRVETTAAQAGPSRIAFASTIASAAGGHATAAVTVATVDRQGRVLRVPADLAALLG